MVVLLLQPHGIKRRMKELIGQQSFSHWGRTLVEKTFYRRQTTLGRGAERGDDVELSECSIGQYHTCMHILKGGERQFTDQIFVMFLDKIEQITKCLGCHGITMKFIATIIYIDSLNAFLGL